MAACLLESRICPEEQPGHQLEGGQVGFKVGLRAEVAARLTQRMAC